MSDRLIATGCSKASGYWNTVTDIKAATTYKFLTSGIKICDIVSFTLSCLYVYTVYR
jgi:hypothetical protein